MKSNRRSPEIYKMLADIRRKNNDNPDRFWRKVAKHRKGKCWPWMGCTWNGYGEFGWRHKVYRAHRIAFQLTNGPIPKGLCVCHKCDNKICCNPEHLFLGTLKENNQDRMRKGRSKPRKGEANGRAKLKESDVRTIRLAIPKGRGDLTRLSRQFGVSVPVIAGILAGRLWKFVA